MKKISLFSLFALVSCVAFSQWSWQNQLPQGNKLNCIRAINTSTVYAVGNCGTILKTTNGGTNWVILNPGISADLLSAFFIHADTGYAVGAAGVILKTVNGGADWIEGIPSRADLVAEQDEGGTSEALRRHLDAGRTVFFMPTDVAVDSQGRTYVADGANDRIVQFSPEGEIDYKTLFANAKLAGLKYFVIEQDTAGEGGRDTLDDCKIAYQNLRKMLS